jgi:hypothetical protein
LGGAGSTPMLNNFADDVLRQTQNITGTAFISSAVFFNPTQTIYPYFVDYSKYITKVEETVRTLDQRYKETLGDMRFDALVATQRMDRGALLHYVYAERVSEPVPHCRVLVYTKICPCRPNEINEFTNIHFYIFFVPLFSSLIARQAQ